MRKELSTLKARLRAGVSLGESLLADETMNALPGFTEYWTGANKAFTLAADEIEKILDGEEVTVDA